MREQTVKRQNEKERGGRGGGGGGPTRLSAQDTERMRDRQWKGGIQTLLRGRSDTSVCATRRTRACAALTRPPLTRPPYVRALAREKEGEKEKEEGDGDGDGDGEGEGERGEKRGGDGVERDDEERGRGGERGRGEE